MFVIQSQGGLYFYGTVGANPIWSDREDAKTYDTEEDAAADEKFLEDNNIQHWLIPV